MRPVRTTTGTNRKTGSFAWLGVVAVLLFQAQLVLHPELDHELSNTADDVCEVCLKLDNNGDAPNGDTVTSSLVPAAPAAIDGTRASRATLSVAPYGARAPPLS